MMKKIIMGCVILLLLGCQAVRDGQPVDLYQNGRAPSKSALMMRAKSGTVGAMKISGTSNLVPGSALFAYMDQHEQAIKNLKEKDIVVVRFRDYVKLIIPTSQLFDSHTNAILASSANTTLDNIVDFIRPIPKIAILVSVYTDTPVQYDDTSGILLSKAQARTIADYLWTHNSDSRVIAAAGVDDPRPSISQKGIKDNRVEIILRDVS